MLSDTDTEFKLGEFLAEFSLGGFQYSVDDGKVTIDIRRGEGNSKHLVFLFRKIIGMHKWIYKRIRPKMIRLEAVDYNE
jgi:hypothetical protein